MNKKLTILVSLLCSSMLLLLSVDTANALSYTYVLVNNEDDGDSYTDAFSDNTYVYVACGTDGVRIYNRTSFALVESRNDGANCYDISVYGTCVFVAGGGTGLILYKFNPSNNTLTLNDTAYDLLAEDYYTVFAETTSGLYVYAGCGGEGIFAYTYDYDAGTLTLAGSQLDDLGSAMYRGVIGTDAYVYVACGGDGLRAYTWDGANFGLVDTIDNSTDIYYDVTQDFGGYIYTANGVDGTYVYTDTGTFALDYNRSDSSGESYIKTWTNGTIVHYACENEGMKGYNAYDGVTMEYLDSIRPTGTYCSSVYGDDTYIYYTGLNAGLYWFTLNPIINSTVTTNSASSVSTTSATLNGLLTNDGGEDCTVRFEYGTTIAYGSTTSNQTKATGEAFLQGISGLTIGTMYHYRALSTNSNGTAYGADVTFNTTSKIEVNWTGIFDGIGRMFTGGEYYLPNGTKRTVTGIFGGGFDTQALFGLFIFLILFLLTALFGMGILVGSVIMIPSVFAVIGYIPELRVIVAIIAGLVFGIGINRFVRR